MTRRIFLHPGEVISKHDGDIHYISAGQLANLYGVDLRKCLVAVDGIKLSKPEEGDIHLYPRYNGDYEQITEGKDGSKNSTAVEEVE